MLTFFTNYFDLGIFLLRIAVGIIFVYHSSPKLKHSKNMAQKMGMPSGMILLLGTVELLAGLGLIFGVFIQWAALLLALVMIGAIFFKTRKWHMSFAASNATGWEFDLMLLAANIAILFTGGGSIGLF